MISGSIVAIVTPMKKDGSIDWETYRSLIEFQIENGTKAIVATGTSGEASTIEPEEQVQCIEFVVKTVAKRIPVIAGTGANATKEAIHLAQGAQSVGADAHLSVVPYYNKPNQSGMLAHFKAIANACSLPLILYNVPRRTACDIAVETVLKLEKIPNIIGIKEASTLERCQELLSACDENFLVYSGEDLINCQIISEGAAGAISVTANVAPKLMAQVCELAKSDFVAAKAIDDTLQGLHKKLFVEPNPIPTKWALSRMGLIENNLRLPLVALNDTYFAVVEKALNQANIYLSKKD